MIVLTKGRAGGVSPPSRSCPDRRPRFSAPLRRCRRASALPPGFGPRGLCTSRRGRAGVCPDRSAFLAELARRGARNEAVAIVVGAVQMWIEIDYARWRGVAHAIEQQQLSRGTLRRKHAEIRALAGSRRAEWK